MQLLIINGPNLNNIGIREPNMYGNINFSSYYEELKKEFDHINFDYFHSTSEADIVAKIHQASSIVDGIILNAGAYSHTSVAIRDSITAINTSIVLVHISNIYSRESFRHQNLIAPVCKGIITGFGLDSYRLAILSLINKK